MSNVSLSEQMGAMALIDELRYSQAQVQQHLDLPGHRQLVAERIREYYKSRGVAVDDGLVEEGVRSFFAGRFTYEAPKIGLVSRFLAGFYVNRGKWLTPWLIAFVVSAGVAMGLQQSPGFFGGVKIGFAQAQVDKAKNLALSQALLIEQLQTRLLMLESGAVAANLPAAEQMLKRAKEGIEKTRSLTRITLPQKVTEQSRENDLKFAALATDSLRQGTTDLRDVAAQLDDVTQLLAIDKSLKALLASASFTLLANVNPLFPATATKARSVVDQADTLGVPAAQAAVQELDTLIGQSANISPYLQQLQEAGESVLAMGLSEADRGQFQPLLAKVSEAIKVMDIQAAQRGLEEIARLKTVAATPLSLEVVSRVGEKSMVERNYDPTGGKTWYLLTEALDASGTVVPVPITSSETGERRYASIFGVRVSQASYQETKNDKLLDGHVDNRLMARKAANSLTFTFVKGPVKAKPDYILEW